MPRKARSRTNRKVARAKQASDKRNSPSILDMLVQPEGADIEFDPPKLGDELPRIPDLSCD